jgi:DNA-binding winged helix-turn-helix (wHTH) protein/Tol biopolymer transport system component
VSATPTGSASISVSTPPPLRGYAFGEFRIDVGLRKLWQNDAAVQIPSRAFDALVYLIEHRDRLVQKDEIIAAIWQDVVVTDDSLIHAISVLRRALTDERQHPKYIETIPRRGYRFIAPVQIATSPAAPLSAAPEFAASELPGPPEAVVAAPLAAAAGGRLPRRAIPMAVWLAAAGAAVIAGPIIVAALARPSAGVVEPSAIRLFQPPPAGTSIASGGVLSPDGRYLAFVARDDALGKTALWVRALYSDKLERLDATDDASKPFWAPDSYRIGFFANRQLLTTSLANERPRAVAAVELTAAGGSWGSDDTLLFANWAKGIYSVRASGDGQITAVAALDREAQDIAFAWPQFLPDGRHFLYQVVSLDPARTGSYVGDLDTLESTRLLETESPAVFAPPRYVLHVRKDMLIAEEFDVARFALTGRALVVARGVSAPSLGADNIVSAAANLLAFQHGVNKQNLAWFDRAGENLHTLAMPTVLFNPRVSPDGSQLLATSSVTTDPGLWVASLSREEFARLEKDAIGPLWAPDGRRIAFTARGGVDLLVRPIDGRESSQLLITDGAVKILNDWSPDGTHLVYTKVDDRSGPDLWAVDVESAAARPLLATPFSEFQARISPDGRWIAYSSDESGALEVYVQRYPELGDKRRVSIAGGGQAQWRADQRELFYLSADRSLMSVEVDAEDRIAFGAPRKLFRPSIAGDPADARDHYVATADGTKFLVDGAVRDGNDAVITVMVNWSVDPIERSDPMDRSTSVSQLVR